MNLPELSAYISPQFGLQSQAVNIDALIVEKKLL
jgi:hypothetical protein